MSEQKKQGAVTLINRDPAYPTYAYVILGAIILGICGGLGRLFLYFLEWLAEVAAVV